MKRRREGGEGEGKEGGEKNPTNILREHSKEFISDSIHFRCHGGEQGGAPT